MKSFIQQSHAIILSYISSKEINVDLAPCLVAEVKDVASSRSYADGGAFLMVSMFLLRR